MTSDVAPIRNELPDHTEPESKDTQMSANRGINQFGQRVIDTLAAELKQLDTLTVFKGRKYDSLTTDQR